MLKDGIYGLAYAAEGERMPTEGRIFGSDPWGRRVHRLLPVRCRPALSRVQLRLEVPPDGQLIAGFSAGPGGASLDIEGAFEGAAPRFSTVIEVAGATVRVELTYLGPLPT